MPHDSYLLLVDDDDAVHYMSQRVLKKLNVRVRVDEARNGEEACELIELNGPPDLLLLDLRMPCMDGHQVLEWLRSAKIYIPPVVFVLSSSVRPEDQGLVEEYSFVDAYVEKPLRRDTFTSLIASRMELQPLFAAIL